MSYATVNMGFNSTNSSVATGDALMLVCSKGNSSIKEVAPIEGVKEHRKEKDMKILNKVFTAALAGALLLPATGLAEVEKVAKPKTTTTTTTTSTTTTTTPTTSTTTTTTPSNSGSLAHHEFHSDTLDRLSHSDTGHANGRGAPSSSVQYDGAKRR